MQDQNANINDKRVQKRITVFFIGIILLIIGFFFSLSVGSSTIEFQTVLRSLFFNIETQDAKIIQDLRLPRAIIGAVVGANLAMAGAIMQAMTKNPLASPQVFGINAGASLMVVIGVVLMPHFSPSFLVAFAFIGAALGGAVVYYLASSGGMTPVKLALAGITVHLFLSSITEGLIIFHEHTTEDILFWLAGAVDGTVWRDVNMIYPWSLIGIVMGLLLSRQLTLLGFGDELATGLGQKIALTRILSSVTVILLAGSSVAVAGPIGFVGLIIPHIARKLVGFDYRLVIPASAIFGAVLLVNSDVLSRFISFPSESPVGIVTALIGGPFFLYIARKGGKG
ncbi:iron ABC transporter permease [Gracilibacillus sp. YIM 98692]|uniref:FecCD family ABC transporter permease n=1 Tax=Gracilibacillus sp. YIM 98692 TaxID=2663532 RepID=UPI0013D45156|nr:iron ABC transporter permease [Gracilibacillus sp. YIM 98692]